MEQGFYEEVDHLNNNWYKKQWVQIHIEQNLNLVVGFVLLLINSMYYWYYNAFLPSGSVSLFDNANLYSDEQNLNNLYVMIIFSLSLPGFLNPF